MRQRVLLALVVLGAIVPYTALAVFADATALAGLVVTVIVGPSCGLPVWLWLRSQNDLELLRVAHTWIDECV